MSNIFNIRFKDYSLYVDVDRNSIESILIYGSQIMGGAEKNSDLDLLIIIDDCPYYAEKQALKNIASELNVPEEWINIYTKSHFKKACEFGDYVCWHIKLHNKLLYSRTDFTSTCFQNITIFTDVTGNIYYDIDTIEDTLKKFYRGDISSIDVVKIIANRVRTACILLCYMNGIIEFSKYRSIELCYNFSDITMPFSFDDYKFLYQIKQSSMYPENFHVEKRRDFINYWYKKYMSLSSEVLRVSKRVMNDSFRSPLLYL